MNTNEITTSQFHIWRTLFSVAHADNVFKDEEVQFMTNLMRDINFSDEQTAILKDDISNPKDAETMFHGITDQQDRIQFFDFARDLVWIDGEYDQDEKNMMLKLHKIHVKSVDMDTLVEKSSAFELEEDPRDIVDRPISREQKKTSFLNVLNLFRKQHSE